MKKNKKKYAILIIIILILFCINLFMDKKVYNKPLDRDEQIIILNNNFEEYINLKNVVSMESDIDNLEIQWFDDYRMKLNWRQEAPNFIISFFGDGIDMSHHDNFEEMTKIPDNSKGVEFEFYNSNIYISKIEFELYLYDDFSLLEKKIKTMNTYFSTSEYLNYKNFATKRQIKFNIGSQAKHFKLKARVYTWFDDHLYLGNFKVKWIKEKND